MTLNISGFWSGKYWYDEPGQPIVPFLALLEDSGGTLSGEITEPNTAGYSSSELKAFVIGSRDGNAVTFAKVYDGASDLAHRVDYVGGVSDDGTRLTGYWLLDIYSGGFEMSRTIVPEEDLEASGVEVVETAHTQPTP
ncbi:MAG: hypothetical protein SFV20_05555 [Sphingopyxis sp.]|nr:hypothetical protein [Sphingopyxis sp.]